MGRGLDPNPFPWVLLDPSRASSQEGNDLLELFPQIIGDVSMKGMKSKLLAS